MCNCYNVGSPGADPECFEHGVDAQAKEKREAERNIRKADKIRSIRRQLLSDDSDNAITLKYIILDLLEMIEEEY
jgi:hypothetical protein